MTKHKVLQTTAYFGLRKIFGSGAWTLLFCNVLSSSLLSSSLLSSSLLSSGILLSSGVLAGGILSGGIWGRGAIAQQISPQVRQSFLADPLKDEPRDPLLPTLAVERPLSPLELRALSNSLDALTQTAQQRLAAGETDVAFAQLRRAVRLMRIFGSIAEFNAIVRVADLAWEYQRPVEVQLLTLRTREIWDTLQVALGITAQSETFDEEFTADGTEPARILVSGQTESDIVVLTLLAQTFTTLRDVDSAAAVYQQLIQLSLAQGVDPTIQIQALGELHLAWFQFAKAADVYRSLLQTARVKGDQTQEIAYLDRLIYSYQQAAALPNALSYAVRAQTDLLAIYQARGEGEKLPVLLLAIAQNYRTLNRPNDAIEYYRSAYSAAQRFSQFSFSAQVLKELGALYETLSLNDQALSAYNLLVPVEAQAYNDYGVMNAYDSIGQLQRRLGNSLEALKAFEQALVIAARLKLKEDYFIEQIKSVTPSS